MKKFFVLIMAVALMVFGASLIASAGTAPGSGIVATSHDLSRSGPEIAWGFAAEQNGGAGRDRICIYCHAPHHTLKPGILAGNGDNVNYMPLWNHNITTTPLFTMYTNGTDEPDDANHMSAAELLATSPGGISMLCLSCHDGSVATNQYGTAPADPTSEIGTGTTKMTAVDRGAIGLGGDLSNHHPIGFVYDDVVDDEIAASGTTIMVGTTTIGDLLWSGKMECGTCHDVHNTKNEGRKFTWKEDTQSAFCLVCHLKNQ